MDKYIVNCINNRKINNIILKYYPYVDDNKNLLVVNDRKKDMDRYIKKCNTIKEEKYCEISVNNTYAEIYDSKKNIYYKRELYLYVPNNIKGIYILELRLKCNANCIPHIIDYHSNIIYDKKIYEFPSMSICHITANNNTYIELIKILDIENIYTNIKNFTNMIESIITKNII